ncbi:MAG: histidinol dehydrogenase [Lysobacterales bacterium]
MERINWSSLNEKERGNALSRPVMDTGAMEATVAGIIARIRDQGDEALRDLTRELDGCLVDDPLVPEAMISEAGTRLSADLREAIAEAAGRIEAFHEAGRPSDIRIETAPGLVCEARYVPISSVGLYIPGGSAPLISTVLMLAIPARLAGCPQVILCSPPDHNGEIDPAILYAARFCGVRHIYRMGGAQAIAAMAFGTERVPACRKLFGPGNAWVTEAKRQAAADPAGAAQDMPAGPSEVMIIANGSADPRAVCYDLLSQAEHGPDSQSIVVSDSGDLLNEIAEMLPELTRALPRASVLEQSLEHARLIRVDDMTQALAISEDYAPEHLILNGTAAESLAGRITTAGSIFLGPWTPESLGDYSSGTNHVLPTYGHAHAFSGLSMVDFQRRMTVQQASEQGLSAAAGATMALAEAEGLDAHRMAVACRLETAG